MSSKLQSDGIGGQGITLRSFAEQHGLSLKQMEDYCIAGKISGARKHPLTKKWWIYPPAKLLCASQKPRASRQGGLTLRNSGLPAFVQA
jgi:hypothetical protein